MGKIHLVFRTGAAAFVLAAMTAIEAAAQVPVFDSLYDFKGPPGDGYNAHGPVSIGPGGVLYGTTVAGGGTNLGTVYSLTPPAVAGGSWTESVLYAFPTPKNGAGPQGGIAIGSNGVLYGTASKAGVGGFGTVYALHPPSTPGGVWLQKLLHTFMGGSDGATPDAGPVIGSRGVLYGTTYAGGPSNAGTVYSLTPPATQGGAWKYRVLYAFTGGPDGGSPMAPVIVGPGGVLYGTTVAGGIASCSTFPSGCGTVFQLTPPSAPGGAWTESVLHAFEGGNDGVWAYGPVTLGAGGVLYGTTYENGTTGLGTVFSLTPPAVAGGAWTEEVIYTFPTLAQGNLPTGALAIGANGVLYGTTLAANGPNEGNVFSLTPPASPGGAWTETVLYSFTGDGDGANPYSGVVMGPGGVLYGTTQGGGLTPSSCRRTLGCGTVYSVTP